MNNQKCAGCTSLLKGALFMQCFRCADKYHHTCLNFNKQDFNGFSKEFKASWVCPACRCREPKPSDNSNTPIRSGTSISNEQMGSAQSQPTITTFEYDNVTLRTRPRSSCTCSSISADSIRDIIREELDRKFCAQFDEFQQTLLGFQESLASYQKQSVSFKQDNVLQKKLTVEMQNELRAVSQDLTKRIEVLEHRSNVVLDAEERPWTSQRSQFVVVGEKESTSRQKARRMPCKKKNILAANSPKTTPENTSPSDTELPATSPAATIIASSSHALSQPTPNNMAPTNSIEHQTQTTGENWIEVRRRSARQTLSLRCLAGPAVTSLKAVETRKYIHLWNMLSGADEIMQYLTQLFPQRACTVEDLRNKNNYKSFKIGVPEECFDRCFSVNIWPENARLKKWVNYRKRKPENQQFQREVGV